MTRRADKQGARSGRTPCGRRVVPPGLDSETQPPVRGALFSSHLFGGVPECGRTGRHRLTAFRVFHRREAETVDGRSFLKLISTGCELEKALVG